MSISVPLSALLKRRGAINRAALALRPDDTRAKVSAALCDELLAAPSGKDGKLTRESLSKLHIAMQQNDESGSPVTWGEHVTHEQYNATPAA